MSEHMYVNMFLSCFCLSQLQSSLLTSPHKILVSCYFFIDKIQFSIFTNNYYSEEKRKSQTGKIFIV